MALEYSLEYIPSPVSYESLRTCERKYASQVQNFVNQRVAEGWDFNSFLPGPSVVGVTAVFSREAKSTDGVSDDPA